MAAGWPLDARYLKRYQRMLGGLYQSVLRAELSHRYGVAWEPIVNGQAEIAGMPRELLDVFSKRAGQVDVALAAKVGEFRRREGRDPTAWERAALCREASADTRAHKTGNGVRDLRTRWAVEAAELDWTPDRLAAAVDAAAVSDRRAATESPSRSHRSALRVGFDVVPCRRAAGDLRPPAIRVPDVGTAMGRHARTGL